MKILIQKYLSVKGVWSLWCKQAVELSELPDKSWKAESIDSLLKNFRRTIGNQAAPR